MKLIKIEGTRRIRLLPWRYDEPALEISMYGVKGSLESCRRSNADTMVTGLSPRTFGAPDPLHESLGVFNRAGLVTWKFFIAPCIEPPNPQVKMVHLVSSVYTRILDRMLGMPATGRSDEEIMEKLRDMPGTMSLAEALANANPPMEHGWEEEPLDVTDLKNGCDILVRKQGSGIRTTFETAFKDPTPLVTKEFCEELARLQNPIFNAYEEAELVPSFDLALYLDACAFGSIIVTEAVKEQLAALPR